MIHIWIKVKNYGSPSWAWKCLLCKYHYTCHYKKQPFITYGK